MAYEELLTRDAADNSYLPLTASRCVPYFTTLAASTASGITVTVEGASFTNPPVILPISGTDEDYNKITAVSATDNVLTFTLSSSLDAAVQIMIIDSL